MSYEVFREKITRKVVSKNILSFLKEATKYNILDGRKVKDMQDEDFLELFPFANPSDKNKFKNFKNTEFALTWFKKSINRIYSIDKSKIEKISGIFNKNKLNELNKKVKSLIPYSFVLHANIKLTSPYFSKDDDEFYLIQNPCLKDKAFKVPMIRGSGWKGAIAKAGKDLINEDFIWFSSYTRIFGTGSEEYRKLIEKLAKDKNIADVLIRYLLFELGKKITKKDIENIKHNSEDFLKKLNEHFFNVHKGRAILYPTYFDKLSLEIINPHSRKTRAGKNPVHYEVVPRNTEGILQIVYIPHDGILTDKNKLRKEVEKDIEFLTKCIEKTAENGVGAKTKLGWGRFEISDRKVFDNSNLKIPEGWEKWQN
ncbi:RAMP superfamily CRISPR-associated protein [Desulfurobacterium sp.]